MHGLATARAGAWKATGDEAAFTAAWAEGRALPLEVTIAYPRESDG